MEKRTLFRVSILLLLVAWLSTSSWGQVRWLPERLWLRADKELATSISPSNVLYEQSSFLARINLSLSLSAGYDVSRNFSLAAGAEGAMTLLNAPLSYYTVFAEARIRPFTNIKSPLGLAVRAGIPVGNAQNGDLPYKVSLALTFSRRRVIFDALGVEGSLGIGYHPYSVNYSTLVFKAHYPWLIPLILPTFDVKQVELNNLHNIYLFLRLGFTLN